MQSRINIDNGEIQLREHKIGYTGQKEIQWKADS